jgi:chlorophyll synthase
MMLVPQLVVIALLGARGQWVAAGLVGLVAAVQVPLMRRLLTRPRELAPWYNATGISLYVSGMMITAVALRLGHGA